MTAIVEAPERKYASATLSAVTEDGAFEGYASLFGKEDLGGDVVEPGAFAESLKRRGPEGIRLLFQHDPAQPIGVWDTIREDAHGLFVRGRLTTSVDKAREVLALMRAGAIDGLSIGFRTVAGKSNPQTGLRHLSKVDLWEISVVTFPLLPDARVARVKGNGLPSERDFERWLRREAGLTRSEARTLITKGYRVLRAGRDAGALPPETAAALVARIRAATSRLNASH